MTHPYLVDQVPDAAGLKPFQAALLCPTSVNLVFLHKRNLNRRNNMESEQILILKPNVYLIK